MVKGSNQNLINQLPRKVTWSKTQKININQLPFGVTWLNYETKVILYRLSAKVTTYNNQLTWREK